MCVVYVYLCRQTVPPVGSVQWASAGSPSLPLSLSHCMYMWTMDRPLPDLCEVLFVNLRYLQSMFQSSLKFGTLLERVVIGKLCNSLNDFLNFTNMYQSRSVTVLVNNADIQNMLESVMQNSVLTPHITQSCNSIPNFK